MSIDLSLHRISNLLVKLPQYTRPTIHIAGTNGKGSVTSFLSHALHRCGLKVGRFNSPHLMDVWDCITLNNKSVSQKEYAEASSFVAQTDRENEINASTFELLTATALYIFQKAQVDVAVVEVGMGGRLDATNAIPDECIAISGITSIDLDHQQFLGNTLPEIAREKAGIVRERKTVVLSSQNSDDIISAVKDVVDRVGGRLVLAVDATLRKEDFAPITQSVSANMAHFGASLNTVIPMFGSHQLQNLGVAVTIIDEIHRQDLFLKQLTLENISEGIKETTWPGRLQYLSLTIDGTKIPILADGAHNPSSARLLSTYLESIGRTSRRSFIISLSHSPPKTPLSVLEPLLRKGDTVVVVPFSPVEGMPWVKPVALDVLEEAARSLVGDEGRVVRESSVIPALERLRGEDFVVVAGSLYLVADLLRYQRDLESINTA
ncbi:Mur ligase [Sistotremastrum niveocremeum HHB9708]|uniref:Dihydrofolate synthetase n=1 Tax=Sistotremastrum niveocremeum HHB9708 TaxID=1314777 RepID=A0A164WTZ7_9AGAM|nr:Mur ligase [Sistotremastrum niveocremeum HHB9708]